jgi:hypothetical protein
VSPLLSDFGANLFGPCSTMSPVINLIPQQGDSGYPQQPGGGKNRYRGDLFPGERSQEDNPVDGYAASDILSVLEVAAMIPKLTTQDWIDQFSVYMGGTDVIL